MCTARNAHRGVPNGADRPLARHVDDFLTDLANANKPRNTIRAYRGDLIAFAAHHDGGVGAITAAPVRAFLSAIARQAPATRKRKRAAVTSFCRWAVRHDLLAASPMDKIDTLTVPRTLPRPAAAADVQAVFGAICSRRPRKDVPVDALRDRVLFETAYVCGARASEVCGMHVEDLDLRLDDEHARVHGKGGTVRTVLLDDRGYIALLKLYLARSGYTSGPLFRASVNGRGGPLSYDAAHSRWVKYCAAAGVESGGTGHGAVPDDPGRQESRAAADRTRPRPLRRHGLPGGLGRGLVPHDRPGGRDRRAALRAHRRPGAVLLDGGKRNRPCPAMGRDEQQRPGAGHGPRRPRGKHPASAVRVRAGTRRDRLRRVRTHG